MEFLDQKDKMFIDEVEPEAVPPLPKGVISTKRETEDAAYIGAKNPEAIKAPRNPYFDEIEVTPLSLVNFPGLLSSSIENKEELVNLQNLGQKQQDFERLSAKGENLTAQDIELSKDPLVTSKMFIANHRTFKAQERLLDLAEEFEGGLADKVYETLDQMVYDTYTSFRDFTQGITGEGTEVTSISEEYLSAITGLDDEGFDKFLDDRIEYLKSVGEPSWQVYREIQALESMGYVLWDQEWGVVNSVLAGTDALSLGLTGASKVGRLGRSVFGRLRGTVGTRIASDAVEEFLTTGTSVAIRTGIDGEVLDPILSLPNETRMIGGTVGPAPKVAPRPKSGFKANPIIEDAEILEDIVPSAYSTKATGFKTTPPPVSSGTVHTTVQANNIKASFLSQEAKGGFAMGGLFKDAKQWADDFGQAVAKANSVKLIDFDIADEGLQNFKATFRLGKDGGKPYKTFASAQKVANQIENARVVDSRTGRVASAETKSGQFFIETDKRFAKEPTTLDLDEVTVSKVPGADLLWKWFGSAGARSNQYFSNLAAHAEFGALGYKNSLKDTIHQFGNLSKEERNALSDILTYIRDDAKTNTWLGQAEFISQYKSGYGKVPRREVVKAYEDMVQLSDFSWYTMASERLRHMAKKNTLMFKYKDSEHLVIPFDGKLSGKVYNASTNDIVDAKLLPEGTKGYKFVDPKNGWPHYVVNAQGRTRLPTLTDAYPYNSGGPRLNPEIEYFIGTVNDGWQTALGAKSRKEAEQAVREINQINKALNDVFSGEVPADPTKALLKSQKETINDVISKNNAWNPFIEDIDDYVEFMRGRGLKLGDQVLNKPRNTPIKQFLEFSDDFLIGKDLSAYITYARHDLALVEFGGARAANPNPVQAIVGQFNKMVDQAALTQYRIEHVGAWAEAVYKAANAKNTGEVISIEGIGPVTAETLARTITINGDSPLAKKLRQEQSIIVRRLGMLEGSTSESPLWRGARDAWTMGLNQALELNYRTKDTPFFPTNKIASGIRNLRDSSSGGLLSLGFMTKMASPFQVILQGSMAIQISAVSPKNGPRGVLLAGYIREMARNPNATSLFSGMKAGLARMSGLSEDQLEELYKHFATSGRGYMRGAVVEDPNALPGVSTPWTKVSGILRAPYYAGENFAATVSRITAYLDIVDNYPGIEKGSKQFWNLVTNRDRLLTFNLNKMEASMAQEDSSVRILTQWTSYFMRSFQRVFFDKDLSAFERTRLAASLTILWGYGGMGLSEFMGPEAEEPTAISKLFKLGPIDYLLDETVGVQVGDRIAINLPDLILRGYGTLGDPSGNVPAVSIAGDIASNTLAAARFFVSGDFDLGMVEVGKLVRISKVLDDGWLAYTMMMNDVRKSRTGTEIEASFTTFQAFAQAIGLRPSEVTEFNRIGGKSWSQYRRKQRAVEKALPYVKRAFDLGVEGDRERFNELMTEAAVIIKAYDLSPTYYADVVDEVIKKADSNKLERTLNQAIRAGLASDVLSFEERTK